MNGKKTKSVDMSCARKSKRNQLLQWNTNSLAESYYTNLATVGSLPLAKNAKHSPSNNKSPRSVARGHRKDEKLCSCGCLPSRHW